MLHQNYWAKRKEKSIQAKEWVKRMQEKYPRLINNSIEGTRVYMSVYNSDTLPARKTRLTPKLTFMETDSVSAVFKTFRKVTILDGRACLLNFASYKNPGGMFLEGSTAQEEAICHESTLYNVISKFLEYYENNNEALNRALYKNRALYSPDIIFNREDEEPQTCDVITCAAPNYGAAKKYCHVTRDENRKVLKQRIRFVLDVMEDNNVTVPILGAYGCGVFKQDAAEVAELFAECLEEGKYGFSEVVFAVISGPNAKPFKEMCDAWNEKRGFIEQKDEHEK